MLEHKKVVAVSIEGWCIGAWLTQDGETTDNLDNAALFNTIVDSHEAITKSGILNETWLLGYQVTARGLCHHNPC